MNAREAHHDGSIQTCRQSRKYTQSDDETEHELSFFAASCAGAFVQIASAYLQWSFGKGLCRAVVSGYGLARGNRLTLKPLVLLSSTIIVIFIASDLGVRKVQSISALSHQQTSNNMCLCANFMRHWTREWKGLLFVGWKAEQFSQKSIEYHGGCAPLQECESLIHACLFIGIVTLYAACLDQPPMTEDTARVKNVRVATIVFV